MDTKKLFNGLVNNALDFLQEAIKLFKTKPKHSVICFYSAVELILKARLMKEHWTQIVTANPDINQFQSGDFVSVTFKEACHRLNSVANSPIPDDAKKAFDALRVHRNKFVHFYVPSNKSKVLADIAGEQLRSWYHLHKLVTKQWAVHFRKWQSDFPTIEQDLKRQREYLKTKFADKKAEIAAEVKGGNNVVSCEVCAFKSAIEEILVGDLKEYSCLVCDHSWKQMDLACPQCSEVGVLTDGMTFNCVSCGHTATDDEIKESLDEDVKDKEFVAINCGICDSYHSVIGYEGKKVCLNCFHDCEPEELDQCEWCGEYSNTELDMSYLSGCSVCDGKAGWDDD